VLPERLKILRKEKGFTQRQIADDLSIDQSNYAGYESGRRVPPPDKLAKLANLFGVSVDYLLGRSDIRRANDIAAASSETGYDLPPEALEELEKYKALLRLKYGNKK
jgi:transcriptional regulator with XRE-family HTH domain